MARQQGWFALILALAFAAGAVLASFPLQLGLDLRGGSQLTLQVLPAGAIKRVQSEQLEAVKDVLDRRINGLGVNDRPFKPLATINSCCSCPASRTSQRLVLGGGSAGVGPETGTEQEMSGLLKLKRQANRLEFASL